MNILGISGLYHDSAAALCIDGKIIAAVQEERFTRKKADRRIPRHAISYCLNMFEGKLDAVVYYDNPFLTIDRWLKNAIAEKEYSRNVLEKSYASIVSEKLWLQQAIYKYIPEDRLNNAKFYCCSHHISHAASAFYPSPYEEAAIITVDGVGEWATTTIGVGKGNEIKLLKQMNYPNSLGLLYSAFTYFCGFKVNTGEYKLMGLAPYGTPKYTDLIYEHLIDVKEDGSFVLNLEYFEYTRLEVMTGEKFERLFGCKARVPEESITTQYMDIAASIQKVTEDIMLKLAAYARKITNCKNLVLAGGTALNCVSNGKLAESGLFDDIWIQPAAGDAGGSLGAALYCEYMHGGTRQVEKVDSMQGSFLGPAFASASIENYLVKNQYPFKALNENDKYKEIAELLAQNKVIGLFQGRLEFGPRALGGRSIIANPMTEDMQSRINLKIKFRESFRPFAPAVLEERKSDYFDIEFESPYMLFVKQVNKGLLTDVVKKDTEDLIEIVNQKRSTIPAVTHVDYSARIQTVDEKRNPYFYHVIKEFEKLTGCGLVVNTSFNVRGEPIVCTPEDAYRCFMRTDMDVLVLEDYILFKEEQPPLKELMDWREEYELD